MEMGLRFQDINTFSKENLTRTNPSLLKSRIGKLPNIPTHIKLALDVYPTLGRFLDPHLLGPFLLGATSPDIRAITKTQRSDTHFASLESKNITEGVKNLLDTYPELTNSNKVSHATKAFIAGYICHLIADQTWVIEIYRPYFGNRTLFSDPAAANVYDRAVQLMLDNECQTSVSSASDNLEGSEFGVELPFITKNTLMEWRIWVMKFCKTEFTWDRLRFMAITQLLGKSLTILSKMFPLTFN